MIRGGRKRPVFVIAAEITIANVARKVEIWLSAPLPVGRQYPVIPARRSETHIQQCFQFGTVLNLSFAEADTAELTRG